MKFWKRGMALLLAVSACFTFLTACGQTEAAGDQLALAVCVGETPATYDPIYAEEPGEQTVLNHLYENLMRLEQDENGQTVAVNGAARSVDVKENADGTVTYTFRLRGREMVGRRGCEGRGFRVCVAAAGGPCRRFCLCAAAVYHQWL